MKTIKELFNNAKLKVKESKISIMIKKMTSKITDNKIVNFAKTKISNLKNKIKDFTGTHQNVKDCMAGDVTNRFSTKIKKFFKNTINNIQNKSNNGSKFSKFLATSIKILAMIATIAFGIIVIYCIKDVFMYCLMLVATCAAVAISIEFICSILSIATGCKI